jgi:hypothetical protein
MIENFDILIVCHQKDFQKLSMVISSIKSNVVGFDKIHIISNGKLLSDDPQIVLHNEKDILNVDLSKIKYRPNWIYQQLLKLLQTVTKQWYLVIDADTIITRQISPIENGNAKFYFNQNNQNYEPYFNFSNKLKVPKSEDNTFISEIMLFNRDYVKELFSMNELNTTEDILKFIYENVDESSQLSEYELYGNFIEKYHPNEYEDKYIGSWGYGEGLYDETFWNEQRMKVMYEVYGKRFDVMSFHTYN